MYHFKSDGTFVKRLFRGAKYIVAKALMNFVTSVPDSDSIAMATQGDLDKTAMSKIYSVVDALDTANEVRKHQPDDAYVFAAKKGRAFRDSVGAYQTRNEFSEAVVTLDIKGTGSSVVVMSRNNKAENYKSYIDFLVMDKSQAKPVIDVVDDVSSWNVEPPRFTHYGEIYKRVDMRAEVGPMTRNIHITSEVAESQTNGGHIKFLCGFKSVQVENVELTNLGNPLITGRYPLHYHMCENLADKMLYTGESYLRNNSINHSQF